LLTVGKTVDVPLSIQRNGSYAEAVAFSLVNPPSGLTGTFQPASVTGTTTTLTLASANTLQPGTYQVGIQASGPNSASDTKQLSVVVQAQKFTLGAVDLGAPLYPGSLQTVSFPILRTSGFTSPVDLQLVLPPGLTGFQAAFSGGDGSTGYMTLQVDPSVPAGSYELSVRASAAGSASFSQAVTATVQAANVKGFQLSVPVAGPSVHPGATTAVDIAVQSFGGFADPVSYSLVNPPSGITGTFATTAGGATLTLQAASTAVAGSYDLTVRGVSGSLSDQRTLKVQVVSAATPTFQIDAPSAIALQQGIWPESLWVGTTAITITRDSGFTDGIAFSVLGLPPGVTAGFTPANVSGTATNLSFQVGDAVLPGKYVLTLVGASTVKPELRDNRTLCLTITKNRAGFAMAFLNDARNALDWRTSLPMSAGQSKTLSLYTYTTTNSSLDNQGYAVSYPNPITLSLDAAPAGVTAAFKTNPVTADDETNTITFTAPADLAPGSYPIRLKAYDPVLAITNWLDLSLTVGNGTFYVKPGLMGTRGVEVAVGQSVTVPVELGRNDIFWNVSGAAPAYLGSADLSAQNVPSGLTVTPLESSPSGAVTSVNIAASGSMAPGTYTFTLRALRGGVGKDQVIPVKVTSSTGNPDLWIQGVEWGQTVLQSGLRLVPGKPAVLRAIVLADRPSVSGVTAQAVIHTPGMADATLALTGPTTAPTSVTEGQLTQTYSALVPGNRIAPGFTVDIVVDPSGQVTESDKTNNQISITPTVGGGRDLNLTIVPIIHQGLTPNMPTAAEFQQPVHAFWPTRSVNVTFRAPYVTSVIIPQDANSQGSAFTTLMYEMLALRMLDGFEGKCGASDHYFGMVGETNFQGGILGIHNAGLPAGVGLDKTYQDPYDTNNNLITCAITAVHELGHGFNLRHSPDGQAGGPNENYPYLKAKIGSWGLDSTAAAPTLYNPAAYYDIMSYTNPLWVSDFNYLNAFNFFETTRDRDWSLSLDKQSLSAARTLVSGFIAPDGTITLHPLVHVIGAAIPPTEGRDLSLRVSTFKGTRLIHFRAQDVEDLPAGFQAFSFTLDGHDEIQSIEILKQGQLRVHASPSLSLAARTARMKADDPGYALREEGGAMTLQWDANTHPYAAVVHVDGSGRRTTLGLRLTGGEVHLPLKGLPEGGYFNVVLSDGLNPITNRVERRKP
jgi:hypothetical protein